MGTPGSRHPIHQFPVFLFDPAGQFTISQSVKLGVMDKFCTNRSIDISGHSLAQSVHIIKTGECDGLQILLIF